MPASTLLPCTTTPPALPGRHDAAHAWAGLVAASLGIDDAALASFSLLMARHDLALDLSRFFFDAVYAYKRLAAAHASGDDALKALTVRLFEQYKALERRRHGISAFGSLH
jgi:hypothetical protein